MKARDILTRFYESAKEEFCFGAGMRAGLSVCAAGAVLSSSAAEEGRFRFSGGIDYSTGNYDDDKRTTILFLPYSGGYEYGNFEGRISVSWISIDGPGSVVGGGGGGVVLPGGSGQTRTESGIGDTWASLTYEIEAFPFEYGYLDVTGKIKFPTADEDKGLGTGEMDEVLQLDYMVPLDRLTPMATVAYKVRGDPPGVNLRNSFYLSVGADWRQSRTLHVGATLDYQQASVSGVDDPLEVFAYLNYRLNQSLNVSPYCYVGLSNGSADLGGGLQITCKPSVRR